MVKSILKPVSLLLIIIFAAAMAETANAQPRKAHERIRNAKKVKLLDVLNLKEDAADKFLVKYQQHERIIDEKRKSLDELSCDIRKSIEDKADDNKIKEMTAKFIALQKELADAINARNEEMKSILSVTDFAKFLVFENQFPKELQKMIYNKKKNKHHRDD